MSEPVLLRWETLTKRKFDQLDRASSVVLVTCSPLEVHGPHLPLGADATKITLRQKLAPDTPVPALLQGLIRGLVAKEAAAAVNEYLANVKRAIEGGKKA